MTQQAIVINSKLSSPSAIQTTADPIAAKVLSYLTRVGQLSAQNAQDVQRLEAKLDHLIELLEAQAQRPALPAASFPNGSVGNPDNLVVDMARSIYRTVANGKMYWHVRTTRYAKHGVALWPDPETLAALDISEEWLKSLPFDRETPYLHKVCIGLDAEGKKPKIVGLA